MPESKAKGKKVLLFGVGLSTPPMIHYLTSHGIHVTACARNPSKIKKVLDEVKAQDLVSSETFDLSSPDAEKRLDEICPAADIMVSMMPPPCHPKIAAAALKHNKHFFTSSYVSDAMEKLSPEFEKKGLLSINECGVDPGLDHMSAKKVIDHVHSLGGKIIGFFSVCGGLPAPANNNPFGGGYKISWTPYGVLSAGTNNAIFKFQGAKVTKPGSEIYDPPEWKHVIKVDGKDTVFEWYPNRDSTPYIEHYGMPECQSIIRGTYRNNGWCNTLRAVALLGLNDKNPAKEEFGGKTYLEAAAYIWNQRNGDKVDAKASAGDIKAKYAAFLKSDTNNKAITDLEWVGMFSDNKIPDGTKAPIDVMCHLWTDKMQYGEDEKDMLVMQHIFEVEYKDGTREELTSTMVDFGLGKYAHIPSKFTSMARTVSLPLACAIRLKLEGRLGDKSGVVRPVDPEVYSAILDEVATMSPPITFKEAALPTHIWLRHEAKPGEERTALTPETAKMLLDAGFRVTVEKSPTRCIPIEEYEKIGCKIAEKWSWPSAPHPTIIFGLKELPEDVPPLIHRHIHFAHCFKGQGGWKDVVGKFHSGGGTIYDLEFLKVNGRRVAAFGKPAGMAGMALGLLQWAMVKLGKPSLVDLSSWESKEAMCEQVTKALKEVEETKGGLKPSALIIGALGRCGGGAVWVAEQCGVTPIKWDMAETKGGGPFKQLLDVDVLVNCIYLTHKIPPFLTKDMVDGERKLTVFVDVSCDTSNPNNPFPIYNQGTTLSAPILRVDEKNVLDVIAVDHLPSLIPLESSINYSKDLIPYIKELISKDAFVKSAVWKDAGDLYHEKCKEAGLC